MTEAATIPAGAQRDASWAAINRLVVEQAVAIPYVWDDDFQLSSRNVRGAMNSYYASWDLSFSSLK